MSYNSSLFAPQRIYYNSDTRKLGHSLVEVYSGNKISRKSLMWYLEMGYIPGEQTLFEEIINLRNYRQVYVENGKLVKKDKIYIEDLIDYEQHQLKSKAELIKEGGNLFNKVVEEKYLSSGKKVVLPLTAGLDSRMILGGLLQCVKATDLVAFTYGVPGSPDFEISKQISKKLGIKHYPLDSTKYELTKERLFRYAELSDCSVPLFDHWPIDWVEEICEIHNGSIWSGVLGSPLSGGNLPLSFGEDEYNIYMYRTNRLPSISSLSSALLQEKPSFSDFQYLLSDFKEVSHDTLDIYFRHLDLIGPTLLMPNIANILPFGDPRIISFFLSLPMEYRVNRSLMKDIIIFHYPELSSFKSNRHRGLPLNALGNKARILPRIKNLLNKKKKFPTGGKYLPLDWYVKNENEIRSLVIKNLQSLESRNLFNNSRLRIISDEFFGKGLRRVNHGRVIDALVSLEIFLELVKYKNQN